MDVRTTSEVGNVRRRNEDDCLADPERGLLIVADGMGGHPAGDVASRTAVEAVDTALREGDLGDHEARPELLRTAVVRAHEAIRATAAEDPDKHGMGTTLVVAHVDEAGQLLTVAHVGDSRAYLVRDGRLRPLTHDHVVDGLFGQRCLAQAVGTTEHIDPEVAEMPLRPGDRLLLCTDGLTDELEEQDIRRLLTDTEDAEQAITGLVTAALEAGGQDNITILLGDVKTAVTA